MRATHAHTDLCVFLCALCAAADIGILFIVGFGSSMLFGTLVGSAADKFGRKKLCMVFGVLYSISCLTKHVKSFEVLLIGRLLGGISTSILFSSFESWMVHEHHEAKYPDEWLGLTFSLCTTGNGIVAIGSGVVASVVREAFGPVAPFDVSLVFLVVGSVIVAFTWRENTGDASIDFTAGLGNAWTKLMQDAKIIYLGVIQSFFEGAMYIFVFMWTPALEETSPWTSQLVSHGWIFASFMICVLIGSTLFQYFLERHYSVERTTLWMIVCSAGALLLAAFMPSHSIRLLSFFVFEVCVGLFWPSLGFLRSKYVPEDCRATTMNFFRIPLNMIVVLVLYNIGSLSTFQVFILCVAVLMPALICQWLLLQIVAKEQALAPAKGQYEQVAMVERQPPASP
jgi:MFS family permease